MKRVILMVGLAAAMALPAAMAAAKPGVPSLSSGHGKSSVKSGGKTTTLRAGNTRVKSRTRGSASANPRSAGSVRKRGARKAAQKSPAKSAGGLSFGVGNPSTGQVGVGLTKSRKGLAGVSGKVRSHGGPIPVQKGF